LMQDRLIQAQVRHQALELAILLPQLAQLAELADAQRPEALLPAVEGLLTDAHLAADLADRRARLGLTQGQGDLLVGELARLHARGPPRPGGRAFGDRSLAQNARRGGLSFGEERPGDGLSGFVLYGRIQEIRRGEASPSSPRRCWRSRPPIRG